MKALLKTGLCLTLGWLACAAAAQETVRWQAAQNSSSDPAFRPVSVGKPVPLGSGPVVRAQAGDEKPLKVEPFVQDDKTQPKSLPKDKGFTPPPPSPGPVFGNLGMTSDNGFCDGGLPTDCCFGRDGCPDRFRLWGSAEYLMWWQKGQSVPPLVASFPVGGTGFLNDPNTRVLYDSVPNLTRSGGRFTLGGWFGPCCNWGVDGSFFFLARQNSNSLFAANANTLLVRPFLNTNPAVQAVDGELANTVGINYFSQLWGADVNLRRKLWCGPNYWLDGLIGYRHLNLSEGINISETRNTAFVGGTTIPALELESFRTRNQFNGVQIGLDGEWRFWNRFTLGATAKIAFGTTYEIINIEGSTTFFAPAPIGTVTGPGALLASSTNMGRYTAHKFAVAPEVGIKLGYDVTDNLRLFVGYDFLYLSNVVRPGEQIDLRVTPSYRPFLNPATGQVVQGAGGGPRLPAVLFRTSDYWAQGMTFGMLYRY